MNELITIHQYNSNLVRALIDPDDKSTQQCGIMRGDTVNLTFTRPDFIDFQIGDYCNVYNSFYRLNRPFIWTKNFKRNYNYTLTFEGRYFQISRAQYLTLDARNHFTEGKFSLTGKPVDFLGLVVTNMQRVFPTENWQMGQVIDGNYETLTFDSQNCLQVLSTLADTYKTEFLIDGTTISLILKQPASGVVLEHGKGKALYNIEKNNQVDTANIITRLYAYGNTKNLGDNYRDGAPRLRMADSLYIEKNVNRYGVYEATVVFDGTNGLPDIFPTRTGVISAISAIDTFTDDGMDFNINDYTLPNAVPAKITFNTGLLAGTTFVINNYNNATKTFKINPNTDDQTITLPTADFCPAVGDQYVLVDIILPLAYYNDAEARLKAAAQKYYNDNWNVKPQFTLKSNPLYFQQQFLELKLGYSYTLLDTDSNTNRQIRLTEFTRSIRNRNIYNELTLADTVIPQLPIVKLFKTV